MATKGGLLRTGPNAWHVLGEPTYLRQCVEMSLRRLDVDRIDLWQLHRVDTRYPLADQLGVLVEMQNEGKIGHLGAERGRRGHPRGGVLARRHRSACRTSSTLGNRAHRDVVEACEQRGVGFIPWFPIAGGDLVAADGPLAALAADTGYSVAQLSMAWLLRVSPVMLPIPGTGSVAHLEENCAAVDVDLDDAQWAVLDGLA